VPNINSYPTKSVPTGADKLPGTDSSDGSTKNFTLASIMVAPPVVGTFNAQNPPQFAEIAKNGFSHIMIPMHWDTLQLSAGAALDPTALADVNTQITNAKAAGLKVQTEFSIQYPPSWVTGGGVPPFVNETNGTWGAGNGSGMDVRDWVWTAVGRNYVADFFTKCLAGVNLANIDSIRMGGLHYNELHYPNTGNWWGFGNAAQTGTGRTSDTTTCPVPGLVPYGTANAAQTAQFIAWYLASLKAFMLWQITQIRAGYAGDLFMMHPGFGLRPDFAVTDAGYKTDASEGTDTNGMMAAYAGMARVYPHGTWTDGIHPYGIDLTTTKNTAAWYFFMQNAKKYGFSRISGENTGSNSDTDALRVFEIDAVPAGMTDPWWHEYPSMKDNVHASIARVGALAKRFRTPGAARPPAVPPLQSAVQSVSPLLCLQAENAVQLDGLATGWNDTSGRGLNATAQTGAARPAYNVGGGPGGRAYLTFDGVAQFLSFAGATLNVPAHTIFAVVRARNTTATTGFMTKSGGTFNTADYRRMELGLSSGGNPYFRSGAETTYTEFVPPAALTSNWYLYGVTVRTGSDFDLAMNGAPQSKTGPLTVTAQATPQNLLIGQGAPGAEWTPCDVAAIMIYGSALSTAQRQAAETVIRLTYPGLY